MYPTTLPKRGNRRDEVFFEEEDRTTYLAWLKEYAEKHAVRVLAYCLMTNHIHLILVPSAKEGLHGVLKPFHMRYAQRINRNRGWSGHVWQGRYFSAPLDEAYTWAAIRYVERNPVRAKMVGRAEEYRWSSAPAHCGLCSDPILSKGREWTQTIATGQAWSKWLSEPDEPEKLEILRRNIDKGLPCGSEEFIERLSKQVGRSLKFVPQVDLGEKKKKGSVPFYQKSPSLTGI